MLERKEKNTEKKESEKYYQRNGYASKEVERLRVKGRWIIHPVCVFVLFTQLYI
jgi:hypothetical protein